MNKTDDIEYEIALILGRGPLTLQAMEEQLSPEIRAAERTWVGIALYRMLGDGRLRAVGCSHSRHEGRCVVEITNVAIDKGWSR